MSKRTKATLLIGILAFGFLLRWGSFYWGEGYDHSQIGDELEAYRYALGLRAGEERPAYIGQPNFRGGKLAGPLWAWFWVAGLKMGGSPEAVSLLVLMLNTFVIYFVYRLAENILGPNYSLWAALFCATSPWAIFFSVGCWNPLPMAFLGGLLYMALWDVVTRPNSWNIFGVCVLATVMSQFHMIVVFIAPVVVLILWLSASRLNRCWLAAGLLVSMALYIPYISGEARHGWQNTRNILHGDTSASAAVLKVFTLPIMGLSNLLSGATKPEIAAYRAMGNTYFGSFWILVVFNVLSLALSAVIVGSFFARLFRSLQGKWRSPRQAFVSVQREAFIGLLLVLPLLLFLVSFYNYSSRYMIVEFPLLFLLPALFMVREQHAGGWRRLARGMIILTIAFGAIFSLAHSHYQGVVLRSVDSFLPSFRKMEAVRRQLKADAGADRRIRLDDTAFPKSGPRGSYVDAMGCLAKYIDLRERYDFPSVSTKEVRTYRALPAKDTLAANERVAYETNGVVFVVSE
jgi:hypothetical protein